jgi:hypothetical protein
MPGTVSAFSSRQVFKLFYDNLASVFERNLGTAEDIEVHPY